MIGNTKNNVEYLAMAQDLAGSKTSRRATKINAESAYISLEGFLNGVKQVAKEVGDVFYRKVKDSEGNVNYRGFFPGVVGFTKGAVNAVEDGSKVYEVGSKVYDKIKIKNLEKEIQDDKDNFRKGAEKIKKHYDVANNEVRSVLDDRFSEYSNKVMESVDSKEQELRELKEDREGAEKVLEGIEKDYAKEMFVGEDGSAGAYFDILETKKQKDEEKKAKAKEEKEFMEDFAVAMQVFNMANDVKGKEQMMRMQEEYFREQVNTLRQQAEYYRHEATRAKNRGERETGESWGS